jgi:hypothetical protein
MTDPRCEAPHIDTSEVLTDLIERLEKKGVKLSADVIKEISDSFEMQWNRGYKRGFTTAVND